MYVDKLTLVSALLGLRRSSEAPKLRDDKRLVGRRTVCRPAGDVLLPVQVQADNVAQYTVHIQTNRYKYKYKSCCWRCCSATTADVDATNSLARQLCLSCHRPISSASVTVLTLQTHRPKLHFNASICTTSPPIIERQLRQIRTVICQQSLHGVCD